MSETTIRDRAAIVGIGQTELSWSSGRSEVRLALEAIAAALEDAGLRPTDVDGLVRSGVTQTGCAETWIAQNLGIDRLRYWGSVDFGGGISAALVGQAAAAVGAGLASCVVCYRALNGRSQRRPGTSDTLALLAGHDPGWDNYLAPHGITAPVEMFAMFGRRFIHERGVGPEQLGAVALTAREHANRNPLAQMHGTPMTLDDYLASPMVASPFRLLDCCPQTDGAAAVVVTTPERARELKAPPVLVKAATQAALPDQGPMLSLLGRSDLLETSAAPAAEELYAQARVTPADIDVAQIYDSFTPMVLSQLEAYGFCEAGEAGAFVAAGEGSLGGRLPINTAGGNLSEGYLQGFNLVLEGVRQVRGSSTSQVPGAALSLVTSGAPVPTSALILGKEGA
jgi:acetyl-CoA acetyltransferase